MANFEIPENPEYIKEVRKFETEDLVHADLFNVVTQALLNNHEFLRIAVEALDEAMGKKLNKNGDLKDNTCTFETDDEVLVEKSIPPLGGEEEILGYATVDGDRKWHIMHPLSIKDKFSEVVKKVTTLFHNVRYLYELLGSNDISKLADGTVTGALSKLNTDLGGIKFIDFGVYDYTKISVDDVVKEIFNKVPLAYGELQVCHFDRGQQYTLLIQSYQSRNYGSAILMSYSLDGIIFYRRLSGVLKKCTAQWTETEI